MTIEHFLSFWSQHNTSIIEGLVALIILLSLFLGYRSFFTKKSAEGDVSVGGNLDAAQLEKTLQKILENQTAGGRGAPAHSATGDDVAMDVDLDTDEKPAKSVGATTTAESSKETEQLRVSLSDSQKKIEALQAQLAEAQAQPQVAASAESAAPAAAGMSAQEKADLEAKLRDLESRLAEYEIISEDIADLSRYKDENEKLQAEIDALKAAGVGTGAATTAAPTPTPPVEEVAAEPVVAESAVEPVPDKEALAAELAAAAPEPAAEPEVASAPAPTADEGANLIDDELMREFAAAVEGQKAGGLDQVSEKAGDGKAEAEKKNDETDALMSDFENFVSKKN